MSDVLLAVDPSVRSVGVALFVGRALRAAVRVQAEPVEGEEVGERWLRVADLVVAPNARLLWPSTVIYECPQIYRAQRSKGDPNQLLGLVGVGASIAALCRARGPVRVLTPTPAEWCGQVAKATTGSAKASPRARRILSRLSPTEAALVPDQHDVLDAVGLGLHALGRLGIKRSYESS
jgi:hypothetical protein